MDEGDRRLRNLTYGAFVELGRAPSPSELAQAAGVTSPEILEGWRRLHEQHALVLDPSGTRILMANPFSAVPTPYRVEAAGREWFGNCAWDSFGICAALHADGRIASACPDCGDEIVVEVKDRRPDDDSLLFHCLVPAREWYDDIGFT